MKEDGEDRPSRDPAALEAIDERMRGVVEATRTALQSMRLESTLGAIATQLADAIARSGIGDPEGQMREALANLAQPTGGWRSAIHHIIGTVAAIAAQVAVEADRERPDNWRPDLVGWKDVQKIEELALSYSLPLVWVPRGQIARQLIDAELDDVPQLLDAHSDAILHDVIEVLAVIDDPSFETPLRLAREAADVAEANRWAAAQTLAAAAGGGAVEFALGVSRRRIQRLKRPVLEQMLPHVRPALLLTGIATAWETSGSRDPTPVRFNRHATQHGRGLEQYTVANALTALMLIAGMLRELARTPADF